MIQQLGADVSLGEPGDDELDDSPLVQEEDIVASQITPIGLVGAPPVWYLSSGRVMADPRDPRCLSVHLYDGGNGGEGITVEIAGAGCPSVPREQAGGAPFTVGALSGAIADVGDRTFGILTSDEVIVPTATRGMPSERPAARCSPRSRRCRRPGCRCPS